MKTVYKVVRWNGDGLESLYVKGNLKTLYSVYKVTKAPEAALALGYGLCVFLEINEAINAAYFCLGARVFECYVPDDCIMPLPAKRLNTQDTFIWNLQQFVSNADTCCVENVHDWPCCTGMVSELKLGKDVTHLCNEI